MTLSKYKTTIIIIVIFLFINVALWVGYIQLSPKGIYIPFNPLNKDYQYYRKVNNDYFSERPELMLFLNYESAISNFIEKPNEQNRNELLKQKAALEQELNGEHNILGGINIKNP